MSRFLRILLCVLLGLATTVAVAQGCAQWVTLDRSDLIDLGTTSPGKRTWLLSVYESTAARWILAEPIWDTDMYKGGRYTRIDAEVSTALYDWSSTLSVAPDPTEPFEVRHALTARGWPLLAMVGEHRRVGRMPPAERESESEIGDGVGRWVTVKAPATTIDEPRVVPTRPLWPGFLVNSAFFTLLWVVVLFVMVPVWRFLGPRALALMGATSVVMAIATTIAVAWICASVVDVHENRFADQRRQMRTETGSRVETSFRTLGAHRIYVTDLPDRPSNAEGRRRRAPSGTETIAEDRRGWPWPAMSSTIRGEVARSGLIQMLGVAGGLSIHRGDVTPSPVEMELARVLPLRPHPPGFAASATLFAASWWVLLTVSLIPRWTRSRRWLRQGRCQWCGYQLIEVVERCPECGRE